MRLRTLLVAGELAVALVLLTGAGLMVKSLWHMNARPPGFHPESVLVAHGSVLSGPYLSRGVAADGLLRGSPAPRANGPAGRWNPPVLYFPVRGVVQVEGAPPSPPAACRGRSFYAASSGYFRAMGIRLIAGRWITDNEPPRAPCW